MLSSPPSTGKDSGNKDQITTKAYTELLEAGGGPAPPTAQYRAEVTLARAKIPAPGPSPSSAKTSAPHPLWALSALGKGDVLGSEVARPPRTHRGRGKPMLDEDVLNPSGRLGVGAETRLGLSLPVTAPAGPAVACVPLRRVLGDGSERHTAPCPVGQVGPAAAKPLVPSQG